VTGDDRHLDWGDCVNVRDLGGHPTARGGVTARAAVVRADALDRLTSRGWDALFEHGVRAVVDLRTADERGRRPLPAGLEGFHVPVFDDAGADELFDVDGMEDLYSRMLELRAGAFAAAMAAVAAAPNGGVVVHCQVGKDRTGLVSAFLLALAGVADDAIAADYAASDGRVGPLVDEWIESAFEPAERARRTWLSAADRGTMLATLELLRVRFGGVEAYLRAAGSSEADLADVRRRLAGS
jgi:protein tyrosine/serine phosphatase